MLELQGGFAHSDFRISKLLARIRESAPEITAVTTRFLHFVDLSRPLDSRETQVLERLLSYGPNDAEPLARRPELVVLPRFGTISPWSSKATDIARICGLDAVNRMERGVGFYFTGANPDTLAGIETLIHDRMTETVVTETADAAKLFEHATPQSLRQIDVLAGGIDALEEANRDMGLALSADEIEYLHKNFVDLKRNPTDVELMMFAQANSEHCRHKIFNGSWIIDGEAQDTSLFDMIRETYRCNAEGVLSAYRDNASVIKGSRGRRFFPQPDNGVYKGVDEDIHILMKVETHNHPTAISPFPGAATGSGGEIRDEAATGRGAKPKAGLVGFSVSNLKLPGNTQPWEQENGKPGHIVSALDIMLEGPIGAAAFNNEFGRPNICGYFRSYEQRVDEREIRGYHKPIMIAGGLGNIRAQHVEKDSIPSGAKLVVLGGPAMLIGLGGGAASSMASGSSTIELDFASVQRGNPEIQRRAQEVIDRCWALGEKNPILSVHDVGAGGLSNALPEIIDASERGGRIDLRAIPSDEPGMSPMEIWCNEAQERFVLAIAPEDVSSFEALCKRERCPYAIVGEATGDGILQVDDTLLDKQPVALPMQILLGKPPKMLRDVSRGQTADAALQTNNIDIREAAFRLLRLPTIAEKGFLVTIGDRTVGGMVHRDQMVGPWQVPVSDVAVTLADFENYAGEAMAMGERTPAAVSNAPASGRMAVAEALTNIAAANIGDVKNVRMSANWMAAAGYGQEDAALFDTVKAVGRELCSQLGITIPVGKDSLSMKTSWHEDAKQSDVVAPLSLIISAFAPVADVRKTRTPQLARDTDSILLFIDAGEGRDRLGGSCLLQVYNGFGGITPDVDDAGRLAALFNAVQELVNKELLLAYHDRSDGGLFVTALEMAIAGNTGINVNLDGLGDDVIAALFNEELGMLLQVSNADIAAVKRILASAGFAEHVFEIGAIRADDEVVFAKSGDTLLSGSLNEFKRAWCETSFHMQALRDNPECAEEEFDTKLDEENPGLFAELTFNPQENAATPFLTLANKPRIAILREQGVNGQVEMAAAFSRAGFAAVDVHMGDILAGRVSLRDFNGMVACGGFSYGDVLGAGEGWAKSILFNSRARDEFSDYFARDNTFSLGVCNGCQMLAALHELIPGSDDWPRFVGNRSEQFEGRLSMVEIPASTSLFFTGMAGSKLPVVVSHGEGRAAFQNDGEAVQLHERNQVAMRFIDNYGAVAQTYPANPNGSLMGITGVATIDGRVTIVMPHPERIHRSVQMSWHPKGWPEDSPWMRMFQNARAWLG
ncbi:MAG: phosphoribosylformylglycinamidine synthase [Gammaproteobacteria bacterium]|nr:phosphoribosylformylglycinamidine synthase [Gammaproteobacteria bacterium]